MPASVPVVESRSKPSANEDNEVEDSMSGNMLRDKSTAESGHAYCHVTSDIPLPSGQSPVVKGIVYLHETVFWGLDVKVKMHDLPVPIGK